MRRLLYPILGMSLFALLVGGPWVYASLRAKYLRNFRVVRDGMLYRSGQLTTAGLARVVHDYGVRTVVSLRDSEVPGQPPPDWQEELWCRSEAVKFVRLSPKPWSAPDGSVPGRANLERFFAVLDDPANHPVLIHCFAGAHRTGVHCAAFRMEFDRWSNDDALAEMRRCGYVNLDKEDDVRQFLRTYKRRTEGADEQAIPAH